MKIKAIKVQEIIDFLDDMVIGVDGLHDGAIIDNLADFNKNEEVDAFRCNPVYLKDLL